MRQIDRKKTHLSHSYSERKSRLTMDGRKAKMHTQSQAKAQFRTLRYSKPGPILSPMFITAVILGVQVALEKRTDI